MFKHRYRTSDAVPYNEYKYKYGNDFTQKVTSILCAVPSSVTGLLIMLSNILMSENGGRMSRTEKDFNKMLSTF